MRQFLSDLNAGNIEPYVKSEDIPVTNDGPVKVAVAKNFDEIVINNGKDTLIEFHSPRCAYCREFAPIFDELGTEMLNEDVEIVKFDAIANETPSAFQLTGYPTFFWLAKASKHKPVQYKGGRNLEDFVKYISEHATIELKKYDRNGEIKKTEL